MPKFPAETEAEQEAGREADAETEARLEAKAPKKIVTPKVMITDEKPPEPVASDELPESTRREMAAGRAALERHNAR